MKHALPRTWSLCMTSENHGTVGKAGDQFTHAPGKHERVQVVEIVAAGSTSAPGVDLSGLMRFGFCDINDDEFIERPDGDYFLVPQVEARCASAAPVAARAGQVAVPSQSWEAIGPLPVDRDENGWWSHPAIPNFDEDVDSYLAWVKAVGLEMKYKALESDPDHPLYNAWFEEGECNASSWEPEEPTGDGWFTFSIHDSEDGPIWAWARRVDRAAMQASTSGERQEGGA